MIEQELLLIGLILFSCSIFEVFLKKLRLPMGIAGISVGILTSLVLSLHSSLGSFTGSFKDVLELFGKIGLFIILFRVGLNSNLEQLKKHLNGTFFISLFNVGITFVAGAFLAFIMGMNVQEILCVGVAFTATSIGVSVSIWEDYGILKGLKSSLLVGVAEFDDLFAVFLMYFLFSVLRGMSKGEVAFQFLAIDLLKASALFFGLLLSFYLFMRFVEPKFMKWLLKNDEVGHLSLVCLVSICILISVMVDLLGLSLAIGAFLCGLAFSNEKSAMREKEGFDLLYFAFAPFFFISIGFALDLHYGWNSFRIGLIFFLVASLSKVIANYFPARRYLNGKDAMDLAISMIPRAEIALVISKLGVEISRGMIRKEIFGAMITVSLLSCILTPLILSFRFKTDSSD